jgi:hypothetical protein
MVLYFGWMNHNPGRTTSRWLRLAGWCLHVSGAPVTIMRAKIGNRKFVVPLEISRPDVIDFFGRSPENDRCGFSIEVRMPRGRQILTVEAQIPESPWRIILATTVLGPLLARPGEGRRRQERDLAATIQAIAGGMIDPPTGTRPPAFFTSVAGSSMRWDCRSMAFAPESAGNFFPQTSTFPERTCSRRAQTCHLRVAADSQWLFCCPGVEIMNADCVSELVSQVSRPEIGIVGARLWYPNGTLQHGGVILGVGGVASHIDGIRRHEPGYFAREHLAQDFCAVTAACLMVRREVFERLGGFDEAHLPITFNDVDFCLRAGELGWRIIYSPYAELIHHESISRGIENTTEKQRRFFEESEFLLSRWGALIQNDPAYNPNLSLGEKRFELAFPPRVTLPWKKSTLAQATP